MTPTHGMGRVFALWPQNGRIMYQSIIFSCSTTDENVGSPRDDPNTDDDGTCLDENTEPERGAKRQSEQTLADIFEPQWKRRSTEKGFAMSKNATI